MSRNTREMRTPMRRVRGLGSARSGTGHFWHMQLTSVALMPLTAAFVVVVVLLAGRDHAGAVAMLSLPLVAIVMLLFVVAGIYHMWLGMQEIVLDYVHDDLPKMLLLMGNTFFCIGLGAATCFAILKIALGL